jgi:hypothetical protein
MFYGDRFVFLSLYTTVTRPTEKSATVSESGLDHL